MNRAKRANLGLQVKTTAWVDIENPNLTVDDAIIKLKELDNDIVEVDYVGRRIKVADSTEYPVEWIYECEYCGAYSRNEKKTEEHEEECMMNNKTSTTNAASEGGY